MSSVTRRKAGGHAGALSAAELRTFQRQLAALNTRGPNPVINLTRARGREVPLVAAQQRRALVAEPLPSNALDALSAAEFVVWCARTAADRGLRALSNSELARVLKVSEARVRQLHASAAGKLPAP